MIICTFAVPMYRLRLMKGRCLLLVLLPLILLAACDDGARQRLQLEELERMNRADSLMTNDSLALTLADWFDRHGTPNEQLRAYYILGRTYADLGEAPQAIEAYNDAADRADTTDVDCNYKTLARVHAQKAELFYYQLMADKMINEERQAMKYAQRANDTLLYIACYAMMAEGYEQKCLLDSALLMLNNSYKLYKNIGRDDLAAGLCCSMSDICRQQKNYILAEKYMIEYETNSGFFLENGIIESGKEIYYSCKGHLCLDTYDKVNAEHYFRKLLHVAVYFDLKVAAYDGLQQYYAKYLDKDSLVKYNHLRDSICNIAHNEVEIQKMLQVQSMYDYSRSELKASQKSREADRLRYTLIIVASLTIILILIFTIVYIRHQNAQRLLRSKYQAEMEKLVQAQADLMALRSEQSVSKSLLDQKEQEIKALQEVAEEYRHKIHTLQGYALNERLRQAPVMQRLHQYLRKDPYQIPTFEDWKELRILINHEIPTFYKTLNSGPNTLNYYEYDVCVLLRLQISPANIAKLKKCTPAYITQIRKGIYKKIFQKEGRADDLDEFILSLS